jgi:hypothetical protein
MRDERFHPFGSAALADALFPLTPALSLGEREPRPPSVAHAEGLRFAVTRRSLLPLPQGEGRGEGEQAIRPL